MLCFVQVEQVMMVERMRQAILEGLKLDFAKPLLPLAPPHFANVYPLGTQFRPAGAPPMHPAMLPPGLSKAAGRGRGLLGKSYTILVMLFLLFISIGSFTLLLLFVL